MRFEYKPSFERSLKALSSQDKDKLQNALYKIIDFFATGKMTTGLGIKRLQGNYWEARSGIRTRILFHFEKDLVQFVLAGSHDQVKRFLKRI